MRKSGMKLSEKLIKLRCDEESSAYGWRVPVNDIILVVPIFTSSTLLYLLKAKSTLPQAYLPSSALILKDFHLKLEYYFHCWHILLYSFLSEAELRHRD